MPARQVFVTKYRHRVFAARHLDRMEQIMRDVRADSSTELTQFNGQASHVHLLVTFPPTAAISRQASSQRRLLPQAAPGVPRVAAALLASETPLVRLLLRRPRGRCAHLGPAPAHRAAEPAVLTGSRPSAFTTGLKAGALADSLVAKLARSFFAFWWDFIIGDDVTLAVGVAAGLALVAVLHAAAAPAWWALPVLWIIALIWSVNRAGGH